MRLTKRRNRLTPLSLLLDLALSAVAIYSACLLTAEVLTTDGSGASAVTAYTLAVVHGATVSIRRLAPRAAVVVLLITAAVYGIGLGLPVFMLGPAVLFVAYAVGDQFTQRPCRHLAGRDRGVPGLAPAFRVIVSGLGFGRALRRLGGGVLAAGVLRPPMADDGRRERPTGDGT